MTDRETGEHVVWFFGTCLDSVSAAIPRYAWKLPWHRARFTFDCQCDPDTRRYRSFAVRTTSRWAPATLHLDESGRAPTALAGFDELECGLVFLTHPLRGFFHRRDSALGSYAIWHDRLNPTEGRVIEARYPLLERLNLVVKATPATCTACCFSGPWTSRSIFRPRACSTGRSAGAERAGRGMLLAHRSQSFMRWAIAITVWMIAAAVLAPLCFFVVLILAGPHSSVLPSAIQPGVLVAGWIAFLVSPILLARLAWRRASR